MEGTKHLTDWLRDAHGMEMQSAEILEKQAARLENYPELQTRIRQHAEESLRQASRIEHCIGRLDSGSSSVKNMMGKMMGSLAAVTASMAEDEVVKGTLADYAFEHFEIGCYRSLIAAAEAVGDEMTARVCREILGEEEAMAAFLAAEIPTVTQMFMTRDLAGMPAKR